MPMQTIALYTRQGQRLLTLKEAEEKGYGSAEALKQRIHRQQLPAYKVGPVWLVRENTLPRPVRWRSLRQRRRRKGRRLAH